MCIEVDDLISFPIRGCESIITCCSESALEDRLAEAMDIIERITGQTLCPIEKCFVVKGSKSKFLFFPPEVIAPAIEIESIKKGGTALDIDFRTYPHHLKSDTYCFGCCEYEICGTFGYETIPAGLKRAIIILALEYSQPGITGYAKPFGVSRADWGDMSISYRLEQGFQEFGRSTGIREVDLMIQEYMNTAGMMLSLSSNCIEGCCDSCDEGTCS